MQINANANDDKVIKHGNGKGPFKNDVNSFFDHFDSPLPPCQLSSTSRLTCGTPHPPTICVVFVTDANDSYSLLKCHTLLNLKIL